MRQTRPRDSWLQTQIVSKSHPCCVWEPTRGFALYLAEGRVSMCTRLTCSSILLTGLISGPSFSISDYIHDGDLAVLGKSFSEWDCWNLLETQIRGPLFGPPKQNLWARVPRNYLSISFLEVLCDYKDKHCCLRTTCYRWVPFGPETHSGELAWVGGRAICSEWEDGNRREFGDRE